MCVFTFMCVSISICVSVCLHLCLSVCQSDRVPVYLCVCVCVCARSRARTRTQPLFNGSLTKQYKRRVYDVQEFDAIQQLLFSFLGTKEAWKSNHQAFVFHCRTGKSRTSLAMTVASMIFFHMRVSDVLMLLDIHHFLSWAGQVG